MLTYVGKNNKGENQFMGNSSDWARFDDGEDTLEDIMEDQTLPEDIIFNEIDK